MDHIHRETCAIPVNLSIRLLQKKTIVQEPTISGLRLLIVSHCLRSHPTTLNMPPLMVTLRTRECTGPILTGTRSRFTEETIEEAIQLITGELPLSIWLSVSQLRGKELQ